MCILAHTHTCICKGLYLQPVLAICICTLRLYPWIFFIQAAVSVWILTDINITGDDESEEEEEEAIAVDTMLDEGMGKHDLPNIYLNLKCQFNKKP